LEIPSTKLNQMPALPTAYPGRAAIPPVTDRVIDCVEIRSSHYQPVLEPQKPYPAPSLAPPPGKGTLIDLWI
jgi:hypothetical protein